MGGIGRQPAPGGADPEPGEAPGNVPGPGGHDPGALPAGSRVLLLNATFEPLAVVTAKRAVVLMLAGKAECVQTALGGAAFHSANLTIPAPSVMRLSRYVRVPYRRPVPMTRAGILRRDGRRCAYCGKRADTIDHVVPRSRGGSHDWDNCVAACRACNSRKADRLLSELGWNLAEPPAAPRRGAAGVMVLAVEPPPAWEPWLTAA